MTTTDIAPYAGGQAEEYQARIVMTPEDARALDEQVRQCTEAVLREGTDYGVIPGTNGEKTLWRPGAQKLLQWFRLECTCDRVEVERDDDGRKHGITYRAEVGRGLKTATPVILATCEGTADYDESKFHQTAEEVQRKAEANERMWAKKDGRVANPTKWKDRGEYRADWNALMKRAQKRAIVGAVNDATAAGGIFSDREEDDTPAPQDDGPSWYEQALEDALTFTTQEDGRRLYTGAAQAARDGLCTPRQANHIQNRIQQRAGLLKRAAPVDVEDLARQAGNGEARPETAAAGDDTRSQRAGGLVARPAADENGADPDSAAAGAAPSQVPQPLPPLPAEEVTDAGCNRPDDEGREPHPDTPGTVTTPQITAIWTILTGVYKFGSDEKDQARAVCAHIAGRPLQSTKHMSRNEASTVLDTLDSWRETAEQHEEQPRTFLIELLATAEKAGDGDA